MSILRIKMGFNNLSDIALITLGKDVKLGMTENPYFTMITHKINEFIFRFDEFQASIVPRNKRCPATASIKDEKRAICIVALRKLAYAILAEVDDNEPKLQSTGYRLTGKRSKRPIPTTPTQIEFFLTSKPNCLRITCKAVKNTDTYEVRASLDKVNWIWKDSSNSSQVFMDDLPLGKIIYIEMRAKNPNGESPWSKPDLARLPQIDEPIMRV